MSNTGIYEDDYDTDSVLGADSDEESNFADTPADGYFSERPHPRDVFVENSSISAEAEAKAREAAEQRAASSSAVPPSHLSSPASSTRSVAWTDVVETPIVHAEAPPPDYEAATSSRPNTQASYSSPRSPYAQSPASQSQLGYGSISNNYPQHAPSNPVSPVYQDYSGNAGTSPVAPTQALPFENSRPGPPQSMRDPESQPNADEESGLLSSWRQQRPKRRSYRQWCCRPISTCNVILAIAIVILIIIVSNVSEDRETDGEHEPNKGGSGTVPMPPLPTVSPMPAAPKNCPFEYWSESLSFDFHNPQNFSFGEFVESSDHLSGGIGGKVTVKPAEDNQDADIAVRLTYATTRPWQVAASHYQKTETQFILQSLVLQGDHQQYSSRPCLYIYATIMVKPGVRLEYWDLSTANLDVEVLDGLFDKDEKEQTDALQITKESLIAAVRGSAQVAYWSSREQYVDIIAGSITGTFALLDVLSLKTQSGQIRVNVDPKKVSKDHPQPASFLANSVSGSIHVEFPTSGYIPEREYQTRVEAVSSSVSGTYILGALTSLHTQSGSIHTDLLPFFDREEPSKLHTDTRSGSTRLNILSPYDYPGKPWSNTNSSHKTTSTGGSVNIKYPSEWEGGIYATSLSGSVRIHGEGVKIITDDKVGPIREVKAIKGEPGNDVRVDVMSGSIRVTVGDS